MSSTQSMTGYGRVEKNDGQFELIVEVKTLNSQKGADIFLRIPNSMKHLEIDLRKLASETLFRGKIEVNISFKKEQFEKKLNINKSIVSDYLDQLNIIAENSPIKTQVISFADVLRLPNVLEQEEEEEVIIDETFVKNTFIEVLQKVVEFRKQEGEKLYDEMVERITLINSLSNDVASFDPLRMERKRAKINERLQEFIDNDQLDRSRLEQELLYYAEKIDISEEKQRLKAHCDFFIETMDTLEVKGRKLNFICQEIGREINTTGSKANDLDIQKVVVKMKDELEKIKEQCANIL